MQGHDGDVACQFRRHHAISELDCAVIGEIADVDDARSVLAGSPMGWNTTRFQTCGDSKHTTSGDIRHRDAVRFVRIKAGAHILDPEPV